MLASSKSSLFLLAALTAALSVAAAIAAGCVGEDPAPAAEDAGAADAVPGKGFGEACTTNGECGSGHCADGVCCDTSCIGVCESCALENSKGTCTPYAVDTDPEHECVNVTREAPDAGVGDASAEGGGGLFIPDGGTIDLAACAGSCDGKRACKYPSGSVNCGPKFCPASAQAEAFVCDGKGSCGPDVGGCTSYACVEGACRTVCAGNGDCQADSYCNGNGQCVPKKENGVVCAVTAECKSGYCVQGSSAKVCCNSSCNDTGMQCDVGGKEGSCSCGSLTCANGCRLFYVDNDGDGHGDPTGTIANQRAVAGCIGTPTMTGPLASKTYYPNNDDCDDLDPNAFPGQTAFFDTANPRIGFDYNCSNGSIEKELPEWPGQTCKVCTLYYPLSCQAFDSCGSQCCNRASQAGFRCGFACDNGVGGFECCPLPYDPYGSRAGFEETVGCGASAPWHVCGTCNQQPNNTSATPVDSAPTNKTQRCH